MYLYLLPMESWTALAVVITLAVLTFVPSKYLYPSQPGRLNQVLTGLGVLWGVLIAWIIWSLPAGMDPRSDSTITRLAIASLFYPVVYLGVSWIITLNCWLRRKPTG
jgi:phosphatidylcholine synthase